MLALCQHNGATYYAQNYAGIIGASLYMTHVPDQVAPQAKAHGGRKKVGHEAIIYRM